MTEADLMTRIRETCERLHLPVFWPGPHLVACWGPGYPDLVIVGKRILFREVKSSTGTLSPRQTAWGWALRAAGGDCDVWDPDDWRTGKIETELLAIARTR
jgi:hypothetical protein